MISEDDLVQQCMTTLSDLLGAEWEVTRRPGKEARVFDAVFEVKAQGDSTFTQLAVAAKQSVTPRTVETRLVPQVELLREFNNFTNLLVVAPWLSPPTRKLLEEHGIGYLDLTGNVRLRVSRPAIVIHTVGAVRAPKSAAVTGSKTTLAGPKAGRLVRLLADVPPPHRGVDLQRATGLSLAYVSRLLDTLEGQLLIRREGRTITQVDWLMLLRARAQESGLLTRGTYTGMIAPNGVPALLQQIPQLPLEYVDGLAITGSFAAQRFAQVAVGGQLMLYVAPWLNVDDVADELGLLPVTDGADVLLLNEPDPFVRARAEFVDGVQYVAPSQAVLDCLSGPGRMPAEGEALLDFMERWPEEWRRSQNASETPPVRH
ncbi:hypothetical protein ACFQ9Q_19515 [Streptomyces virginiae]|uniref:hypothetical protein n=1 Tax=Streptomyces virginiae TaxID=1961 RepID=UPI0036A24E3E